MNRIYLLLGANLGNPQNQLLKAIEQLKKELGVVVVTSSLYESEAWGVTDQPLFYNQIVIIETSETPEKALLITQSIETKLGRVKKEKWGARLIDIDILYFDKQIIGTKNLTIPHPYIQDRMFTLVPLVEVDAEYIHPVLGISNQQMLENCTDNLKVFKHVQN